MENQQYKLKNLKLIYLQERYKYISSILNSLSNHIYFLENIFFIDSHKKNLLISILYDINKNLNISNNNYLKKTLNDTTNIDTELNILLEQFININDNCFNFFEPLVNLFDKNSKPFYEEESKINQIMIENGYKNIQDAFKSIIDNNYNKYFSEETNNILNEVNNIFIPLSINFFNVQLDNLSNTDYYWKNPKKYKSNDILESTRELWINCSNLKLSKYNFIKIEGIFINDPLSSCYKTCQMNYINLYNKKKLIENNNKNIDTVFIKRFMKFDYIGNLYCLSIDDYNKYLNNSYSFYNQLIKTSFINIMKTYITDNSTKIQKLYNIIFLLLLGDDDNADVASLFLGIIKEKKINANNVYNLILSKLPFFLQLKLKKANNNITIELDKIKSLSIEDIDYKKQLISNKFIQPNIKALTLEKIDEMKNQNNEFFKQKTFVEHILKYPWTNSSKNINMCSNKIEYLENIKTNLNTYTYGHDEAKNILLQTIASWISNPDGGGRPLGFVGPPGVGKTLLAKSISKALDIPFAEITLGGQNDGELLHGHGYTYSGSQPGLIIKKMVEMGKERCILYFDELDKTASKHGVVNEITSILIHLTDPNMNKSFQDRFFQGVDFPLDKVIMIFSYNDPDKVDPILLDRITQIKVKPYTIQEKLIIVKDYVIPELQKAIGINQPFTNIDNTMIEYIIDNYTNEAGIRNIKRKIEKIFLTLNLEILLNKIDCEKYILTIEEINRILLKPQIDITKIHDKPTVGIINGLYATTNGDGGIIPIQVFNNFTSHEFEIKLTGSQGNVMKESVQCSLTCAIDYINRNANKYADKYNIDKFKNGFHVHCPSTSTPKDGPSAGCAFTTCFISRILNKPIRNDIAMTGEIELTGRITKIGGLNYKLTGAKKAGVKLVFICKENKEDIDEIIKKDPKLIDDNFQVQIVEYIDDIIDLVLVSE
jgi:endopeptidase La